VYGATSAGCLTPPVGSYIIDGWTSYKPCPGGWYSNGLTATCTMCSAGSYSTVGASACTLCPVGKYSQVGYSACLPCAGAVLSGAAMCNVNIVSCHAGMYQLSGTCTNITDGELVSCYVVSIYIIIFIII
jgi:syndecan 4